MVTMPTESEREGEHVCVCARAYAHMNEIERVFRNDMLHLQDAIFIKKQTKYIKNIHQNSVRIYLQERALIKKIRSNQW